MPKSYHFPTRCSHSDGAVAMGDIPEVPCQQKTLWEWYFIGIMAMNRTDPSAW